VTGGKALIGIVSVRGKDYHPTRRLIEAGSVRGCTVVVVNPYSVWPGFEKNRPVLLGRPEAEELDAVLPRQGAEIRDCCLPLLEHFGQTGVVVINSLEAVLKARNKFFTLQALARAGLPVASTVFVNRKEGLEDALRFLGAKAVAKPVSGRRGDGITLLERADQLPSALVAELDSGRGVVVQEYIPPAGRRDLRVFVVGTGAVAAMELVPAAGDFRANFGLGGRPRSVELSREQADLAVAAAGALGLEVAGVDMMLVSGGRLVVGEVNYSPGFEALEGVNGRDIAGAIVDYALETIEQRKRI